jgi:hypothetical protein
MKTAHRRQRYSVSWGGSGSVNTNPVVIIDQHPKNSRSEAGFVTKAEV